MEHKARKKPVKTNDTALDSENHDPTTSVNAIKVIVRIRPLNDKEIANRSPIILQAQNSSIQVANPAVFIDGKHHVMGNTDNSSPKHLIANAFASDDCRTFHFDRCFTSTSDDLNGQDIDPITSKPNQIAIFDEVGVSMIDSAFRGFHCTVFAYGQTGSGKTHTMFGHKESDQFGLIPRVCEELFREIESRRQKQPMEDEAPCSFAVDVTYCEIYKEKVIDLLDNEIVSSTRNRPHSAHTAPSEDNGSSTTSRKPLKIREHPVTGPFIEGLISSSVYSYEEIAHIMTTGEKARTVASTCMNSVSSRSHAIFTITLTQAYRDPISLSCHEKTSKISLVDLAGSERALNAGTSGERLKEGAMINKSLTTLGRVISALSKKSLDRVPYRDSTLTWLLKESLGGNAKTTMMAMVSPAAENYEETMSTLRYAESAKKVINCALVNEDENAKIVRTLRQEIAGLRDALSKCSQEVRPPIDVAIDDEHTAIIANLKSELKVYEESSKEDNGCIRVTSNSVYLTSERPILVNIGFVDTNAIAYVLEVGSTVFGRGNSSEISIWSTDKRFIRIDDEALCSEHICIECSRIETLNGTESPTYSLRLSSIESEAITQINDQILSFPSSVDLFHGDCIRIGNSHILRVLLPGTKSDVNDRLTQVSPFPEPPKVLELPRGNVKERVDALNALCQCVGIVWSFENEADGEVSVFRTDTRNRVAWSLEEFLMKYDTMTQFLTNLQELLPSSPSMIQRESIREEEDTNAISPSDTMQTCARLHGYARLTLCTTQSARAMDSVQNVSLLLISPIGKCIGNVNVSYTKPRNTCEFHLQRVAFYANAITSESISVIIKHSNSKVEHTIPISLNAQNPQGDQVADMDHHWQIQGNKEIALLLEIWGHGRVLVLGPLGDRMPFSPPRIDFFVSADIQERDADGMYRPVAVKKDGTLRLHLNQARKLCLHIVQADTASFCLRELLLVRISSVRHQRVFPLWRDTLESGKCTQSASVLSLCSPKQVFDVETHMCSWKELDLLEESVCDFTSRTLSGVFNCMENDSESIDPKKSRSVFQLAVSFRQQYNSTPIVIFKSIVVKICHSLPKKLALRQRISRGWEATRTAWWAKESYSRNFRLGTWFTAELLMENKLWNGERTARNIAGDLMETLANGMERMEAMISLEMVRHRLLAMIPSPSSDSNVEILKKLFEKNIPEELCVESDDSDALFLTLKNRKSIRLRLTHLDANRIDDEEGEPVPFLITEPARFVSPMKDVLEKKVVQAAPWQPSVAEMCGFLDIHRSMQLGTAATAIVTNGNSVKWQRRWFVLRRPFLYAYKSMARKEQVGVIEITKCQIIVPMTLSGKTRRHSLPVFWKSGGKDTSASEEGRERQPPFTFQLWSQTGSRSLIWSFRASSCAELRAWLVAIDPLKIEACNALRPIPESCNLPAITA